MAVTEIVTVPINPDPANLENVEKVFPELLKYFKVPNLGILSMFRGWYVNKDGKDVRGEALEALIIGAFQSEELRPNVLTRVCCRMG